MTGSANEAKYEGGERMKENKSEAGKGERRATEIINEKKKRKERAERMEKCKKSTKS